MHITEFDLRPAQGRAVIYVSVDSETILDDFANRHSRPYQLMRPLVEQALRDANKQFKSLRWSQKAGCRCGCSPGFIVKGEYGNVRGYHAWATFGDAPSTNPALSDARREALLSDPTVCPPVDTSWVDLVEG